MGAKISFGTISVTKEQKSAWNNFSWEFVRKSDALRVLIQKLVKKYGN